MCPSHAACLRGRARRREGWGGRGYRERGQGKVEREGVEGGLSHRAHRPTETDRPAASPLTDASILRRNTAATRLISALTRKHSQHLEEDRKSRRCPQLQVFFPLSHSCVTGRKCRVLEINCNLEERQSEKERVGGEINLASRLHHGKC